MRISLLFISLALMSCSSSVNEPNSLDKQSSPCRKVRKALFIGDSITDGSWGHDCDGRPSAERNHGDLNHIYGHGYMYLCASQIQSEYPERDIQFYNRGISGHTLFDMAARWKADCLDLEPDLVSILIGTNDIEYYLGQDSVATPFDFYAWQQTYCHLLDSLQSIVPDVNVVLCTPFVFKSGWRGDAQNFSLRRELIGKLDSCVVQIASDYAATIVRFDTLFCDLEKIQARPDYWVWDGVHPTAAGHKRMADLWLERTESLFTE